MEEPEEIDALKPRRCCICDEMKAPCRTLAMLDVKTTAAEGGWGCVVCRLPFHGAIAVICDDCADGDTDFDDIRFACDGYLDAPGRIPIEQLTVPHKHDLRRHPEYAE
jgi:hypothetical protein